MAPNHNKDSSPSPRLLIAIGFAAVVLSAVFLWVVPNAHESDPRVLPGYSPLLTTTSGHSLTSHTSQGEIASRLERILQIREAAYRFRNPERLREIYSDDCPCLESDERAISELIERGHKWTGITTSIDVRSVKSVSDRIGLS